MYYPVATRFIYHDSPSLRLQDSVFETPRCHEWINPRGPVQIRRLETSHGKVTTQTPELFLAVDLASFAQIPGLVNIQKAIENGHRNSGFSHE